MSILCCLNPGEASEPAREPECNALIVHPLFVSDLNREPETFCPMDWLPDEVISNVLVHLVRPTPALPLDDRRSRLAPRPTPSPPFPDPHASPLPPSARLPAFPGWRRRHSIQRGEPPHEAPVRGRRPLAGTLRA